MPFNMLPREESPLANIGEAIQGLAQRKLKDMDRKGLESIFGMSEDEARFISNQPPEIQQKYLAPYSQGLQALQGMNQGNEGGPPVPKTPSEAFSPQYLTQAQQYLQSPEAQQELSPEEIQQGQQKIQQLLENPQMVQQRFAGGQGAQPQAGQGQEVNNQQGSQRLQQESQPSFKQAYARGLYENSYENSGAGEKIKFQKQKQIDSKYRKFTDEIVSQDNSADEILNIVKTMRELRQTGKVASGFQGRFVAKQMQSPETQQYVKNGDRLASLLASLEGGRQSAYRLKFTRGQKPNIDIDSKAQKALEDNIEREALSVKKRGDALGFIVAANDGLPDNAPKVLKDTLKDMEVAPKVPQGTPDGASVEDIYGQEWVVKNGKAELVGGL